MNTKEHSSVILFNYMEEAYRSLTDVGRSLSGLLEDFSTSPECIASLLPEIDRLEHETKSLSLNLESFLHTLQHQTITAMEDLLKEVEDLRGKITVLQKDNEKTHSQLATVQGETARIRSQLQHQSTFCASLGAVLGNLVWKASRVPPVVDLILSGNKVADFLCIVSGTLESFLETFDTEMPGPSAEETQFIMAMGGIVTNMAAAPAGRQYLVSDPNGRELILQIIKILPVIPIPSGNCLKRLLLMALYNVSINQEGLHLLQEEGKGTVFAVASECLKRENNGELRLMALRLLLSLTGEMKSPALIKKVPKETLVELTKSEDLEVKNMAQEVIKNLSKAQTLCEHTIGDRDVIKESRATELADETLRSNQPTTAWRLPKIQQKGTALQS